MQMTYRLILLSEILAEVDRASIQVGLELIRHPLLKEKK